jgi:single-strand DNA-binding protein
MNEITIHGNLTASPTVRRNADTGRTAVSFAVAVNSRRYDRRHEQYVDRPAVFHRVVCFGELAENAAATLTRGMAVTVTGQFADDSYVPDGRDSAVRQIRLEASDVAVSLRWATAAVTRRPFPAETTQPTGTGQPGTAEPVAQQSAQPAAAALDGTTTEDGSPRPAPAATRPGAKRTRRAVPAAA